jgi:hypothetical protein
MLTKLYLTLRLCPSPALWSQSEGLLRVNPEQSPALRLESRRVDLFYPKGGEKWKRNGVFHV